MRIKGEGGAGARTAGQNLRSMPATHTPHTPLRSSRRDGPGWPCDCAVGGEGDATS